MIFVLVEFSCQNEEVVTEAVDVGYDVEVHGVLLLVECQYAAFGTATHGAADMAYGRRTGAAGEDETLEWGEGGADGINLLLQMKHRVGSDETVCVAVGGIGSEYPADEEERFLYFGQYGGVVCVFAVGDEQTDLRVEFIHSAVCLDACAGFVHSLIAGE